MKTKTALCLCGGGAMGAMFQIGALAALEDSVEGLEVNAFDLYIGSASGASVAASLAAGLPVQRIYRAFLDPDAMAKWLPPHGFTGKVHHMDARVGGSYRMSFTNFTTGKSHSFGGEYLELISNERIRHTDKFDDPNLPGVMQVTIAFRQVSCGTEINITQEGIPDVIPPEACYLGWQESLTLLAQLVEPEIPDGP